MPAAVIAVGAAVAGGAAGAAAAAAVGGIVGVAAGVIAGAVVGGAISAVGAIITGQDVGKAFKNGLISGGISGGLAGAFSAFGGAKGVADIPLSSPGITAETATTSGDFMKGLDLSGNVGTKGADFSLPATADALKAAPEVLPGASSIAESAVSPELAGAVAKQTVAGQPLQTSILSGAADKAKGILSGLMPKSEYGKMALTMGGLQTVGNLISGYGADKAAEEEREAEAAKDALHRSRVNAGISTAQRVMDYRMGSNGLSVTRYFSPSYNKYTEAA